MSKIKTYARAAFVLSCVFVFAVLAAFAVSAILLARKVSGPST